MNRLFVSTLSLSVLLHASLVLPLGQNVFKTKKIEPVSNTKAPLVYYLQEEPAVEVEREVISETVEARKKAWKGRTVAAQNEKPVTPQVKKVIEKTKSPQEKKKHLKPVVENVNLHDEETRKLFMDYYNILRSKIQQHTIYPYFAKMKNIQGISYVSFILGKSGSVNQIHLLETAGSELLDDAAMNSIRNADPFPPFPKELDTEEMTLKIPISFEFD